VTFRKTINTILLWAATTVAVMSNAIAPLTAEEIKIRLSTIPSFDNAAFELARAKGFFQEQGLALDATPTAGGSTGIPALVAGQLEFASSNIVTILIAAARGLNPVIVAAGDTTGDAPPDLAGLVAKKGASFKTGKDLEGKTIALNARNNILWLYAREWVEKTGGDPAKVMFIEVPFPQMVDAVQNGRVDAAMLVEPFLSAAVKGGIIQSVGWPYSDVQKRIPVAEFVTTKAYADANPDIIARFTKAYDKGVDWTNRNSDTVEFRKIVSAYTHVPEDRIADAAKPVFVTKMNISGVEQLAALMKKHGLLQSDIDLTAVIPPSIQE
jgi:NitT/TauT family transport system substrate-binding protein